MNRRWKRTLSILLSAAMLFSMTGMNTVFAAEGGPVIGASGLCEHHEDHTSNCYTGELTCGFVTDSGEDTATESDAAHRHTQECYKLDCRFVCDICGVQEDDKPDSDSVMQTITGFAGFDGSSPLDTIEVTEKSTVAAIGLPDTLAVTIDGQDDEAAIPVAWETADGSDYENTEYETYDFIPVWDAEAYALADGLTGWDVPFITVNIAGMKNPNTKDITTADALKSALEATDAATISVAQDISLTDLGAIAVGASHTLSVAAEKTVTIDGSTGINVDTHTLTIQGAGKDSSTLVCNRSGNSYALYDSSGGKLCLDDITVNVTGGHGFQMEDADIGSGARLVLNVPGRQELVTINGSLDVSGEIDIQDFDSTAISLRGSMTIKSGGTVKVGKGSQSNVGIEVRAGKNLVVESGGTLTGGAEAGGIELTHTGTYGAKVTGAAGTFIDRGQTLTENGQVTVTAATEPASPTGLTAGVYTWNGSNAFEKYDIASIAVSAGEQTEGFSAAKGETLQFAAVVKDTGGTEVDAALRDVEWTLWGTTYASGTTISDAGILTVAQDETRDSVYVMARSVKNPAVVNSSISVSVTDGATNTWNGDGADLTVADGDTIAITSAATGTLDIPANATVTIVGTVTDAKPVQLNLGAGAKVNWAASYTGSKDNGPLVQSNGSMTDELGTIEITGAIINTGTTMASAIAGFSDVVVTGGTVSGQSYGVSAVNVTINAGSTVTSTSSSAVGANTDVIINGGTITGGRTDVLGNAAVSSFTGSITLAGGTITANPGALAVFSGGGGSITVKGKVAISGNVGVADVDDGATTITVNAGGTLTVPQGGTLTVTNTGTIVNNGAIVNSGSIVNNGTITNHAGSTYTGANPTGSGTFTPPPPSGGGGGGGGGGSSSGGSTPTVTPPDPGKPDTATNAETKVTPTVNANGSATVTVPEKSVTDAIKAAQDAAKKAGTEKNGVSVTIDATTTKGASDITATLTEKSVDALIKAGVTEVRIKGDAAAISLDLPALKAAQAVAGGAITVSAKPVAANTLSAAAQKALGNRPAFSFTLQSGGKPVTSFGGGSAAIAIPYTPPKGEDTGKLCVVYVDDNGGVTYLTDSSYDPNTKALIARTGHFSVYGVGYKADAPVFTDTANHWAKDDIDFVAARGLLSGTGNNQFSPNNSMTRGMFVTALGRLAGIDPAQYKNTKFTDAAATAYYAPYVAWAADKGIVNGTTDTTFAPDTNISREQMAVIMANYAKAMGYTVPKTREAVTFADNGSIGSWAKDAVKAMQMAGILNGKDGNRFDPKGTATRAEVAAVLRRYVELVIDPATAQGWTQNDAGQWLYYENGKPVTGEKTIGGTTYHFDAKGLLQKIDAVAPDTKKHITHIIVYGDTL